MRIVSGKYKGRHFEMPRNFKARPTTDFAKENIFNVLCNLTDFEGAVALDLFSGTGSISYELASRGCHRIISVENNYHHYSYIKRIKEELKIETIQVMRKDVFPFLRACSEKFDFIFADPPYDMKEFETIPDLILKKNLLKENGIFVMEHPDKYDFSSLPLFYQHRKYGSVNFSIFINDQQE